MRYSMCALKMHIIIYCLFYEYPVITIFFFVLIFSVYGGIKSE